MKLIKQKAIIFLTLIGTIAFLGMPLKQPIVAHAHSHEHAYEPHELSKINTLEHSKSNAYDIMICVK